MCLNMLTSSFTNHSTLHRYRDYEIIKSHLLDAETDAAMPTLIEGAVKKKDDCVLFGVYICTILYFKTPEGG